MILRSDPRAGAQAGFTLFETLVSLAILSLVLAVSAAALRGPSPAIQLQQRITAVQKDAAASRDQAIRTRKVVSLEAGALACDPDQPVTWFHPDGSASGPDICLSVDGLTKRLQMDPLLGRYLMEDEI